MAPRDIGVGQGGAAAQSRAVRALRADLAPERWIERNQQLMGLPAAGFGGPLFIA